MKTKHVLRDARTQLRRYRHRLSDEVKRSIEAEIEKLQQARKERRKAEARTIAQSLTKKIKAYTPKTIWHHVIETVESLAVAIIVALAIRHFIIEPFKIPTGSMEPTLHGATSGGDFIMVQKFAYGPKIPLTNARVWSVKPDRWDIVVFTTEGIKTQDGRPAAADPPRNFVKRIVGLPGDTLEIRDGWLYVNGEKADMPDYLVKRLTEESLPPRATPYVQAPDRPHVCGKTYFRFNLFGLHLFAYEPAGSKATVTGAIPAGGVGEITTGRGALGIVAPARSADGFAINPGSQVVIVDDSEEVFTVQPVAAVLGPWMFGHVGEPFTVPEDHYFMMGDNSPYSADSRAWGFVPFENLKGRVLCVWWPPKRWRIVN